MDATSNTTAVATFTTTTTVATSTTNSFATTCKVKSIEMKITKPYKYTKQDHQKYKTIKDNPKKFWKYISADGSE